ncbi:MAG: molecular chaperone HtpG, partial [Alphaproteobacteria bacterium]|nr:molecular chaperone HtpG [Alphaproteobacteria bacterium]
MPKNTETKTKTGTKTGTKKAPSSSSVTKTATKKAPSSSSVTKTGTKKAPSSSSVTKTAPSSSSAASSPSTASSSSATSSPSTAKNAAGSGSPSAQKKTPKDTTGERHHFAAEVGRLLDLVARSLYSNRDIFLRELVSNASDACERLRWESLTRPELIGDNETLSIEVTADKNTLTVRDNGIGMNRDELIANLGEIARSGTERFLAGIGGKNGAAQNLPEMIGRFGVGFYSALMVADEIVVRTTRAGETQGWLWRSAGGDFYELKPLDAPHSRGTSVTLTLRDDAREYLESARLERVARDWCDHIAFPLHVEGRRVNQDGALWRRPKSELSEARYTEFYRHISHSLDEPWYRFHFTAEGRISFTALLYVPTLRPFDLYDPDRGVHLKLYVRRVFIAETGHGLLPPWLRFIRGVVDSEDLELNISREMLQRDPAAARLREALVKRTLQELETKAEKDADGFADFWKVFGPVMKEGIYEDDGFAARILGLARFSSTAATDGALVSLDDYCARMSEGQEAIWYLTGEDLSQMSRNPRLEGLAARGEEVLLLTDAIDEFWPSLAGSYSGVPFRSVSLAASGETAPETPREVGDDVGALVKALEAKLGGEVKSVRVGEGLRDSAVCLGMLPGDMDFNLERLLRLNGKLEVPPLRILEINPDHDLVRGLAS